MLSKKALISTDDAEELKEILARYQRQHLSGKTSIAEETKTNEQD